SAPPPSPATGRTRAPLAHPGLDDQTDERQRERDLEAMLVALLERARELALLHAGDVVAVEVFQAEIRARRVQVHAAGVDGDLLERVRVEPRLHDLSLAILEIAAALDRDQLAFGRSDADGVDLHAALGRVLDGVFDLALVVLAVGDEDECLMAPLATL